MQIANWKVFGALGRTEALKKLFGVFAVWAGVTIPTSAQVFTNLANFNGTNGHAPGSVVQGRDGNLWGPTTDGGVDNVGTVFTMTPDGMLTTVHNFDGIHGRGPSGLVLNTVGNFYGDTGGGGRHGYGLVFRLKPGGGFTVLHAFAGDDGRSPSDTLTQGADGKYYGTTYYGGTSTACFVGCGTVFKISPSGTLTVLHNFDNVHGSYPQAGLVQGKDGKFYGATTVGGTNNLGVIFSISPTGAFTVLHNLSTPDGTGPLDSLIQAKDGNFYGTAYGGGTHSTCVNGCGTVFKITRTGTFTKLFDFDGTHGANPAGDLVQGTDGNLYGTTSRGGSIGHGTVFQITTAGVVTVLHNFDRTDGEYPGAGLAQHTNGKFYGTTLLGGANDDGTVFRAWTWVWRPLSKRCPLREK
jgi:uncharacterized repeat protein (TIGR03803 family)